MDRIALFSELYRRFDPEHPVEKQAWRAARPLSPAHRIVKRLSVPVGEHRFLLLGTVGTGKSTELIRIAEEQAAKQSDFVVMLDLVKHFGEVVCDLGALQRISPWEVVFLTALAAIRGAEERFGHQWEKPLLDRLSRHWQAVAQRTQPAGTPPPSIDVAALAKTMTLLASEVLAPGARTATAIGLSLLQKAPSALKWTLPIGLQGTNRVHDQNSDVRNLLETTNEILLIAGQYRPLVLIIDGLDRIQQYEAARELLIESALIQQLKCALVVGGPFILRHHVGTAAVRGFQVETLVNEPVLDKREPEKHGPGVPFFCEVFRQRARDIGGEGLIADAQLRELAYYSGGRARDFVKLIRECVQQALEEEAATITPVIVTSALDSHRRLLEMGLDRGHLEVLQDVMTAPDRQLPDNPRVFELLSLWRLLPYPNESEWYYPHPMLLRGLLKTGLDG